MPTSPPSRIERSTALRNGPTRSVRVLPTPMSILFSSDESRVRPQSRPVSTAKSVLQRPAPARPALLRTNTLPVLSEFVARDTLVSGISQPDSDDGVQSQSGSVDAS